MKESGGGRLKCAVYESTLSTADAVPLPQWGRQRGGGFAAKKKANPASLRSAAPSKGRGSRGHSLLPLEGGAPKGRRLDGKSGMKKSGGGRLKCAVYGSTLSTATRSPFPDGEGEEEAASPPKRKPTPPRCARQPLPREGARTDTPRIVISSESEKSFFVLGQAEDVGIAVFPHQSLPLEGKVPRRGG